MDSAITLAETEAYRDVAAGRFPLSHTAGIVVKCKVQLLKANDTTSGDTVAVISVQAPNSAKPEYFYLYKEEWTMKPSDLEQIAHTAYTEKRPEETAGQVLLNGEFEGEDLPLYDFEIKKKSHLKERILHPATTVGHDQPAKVLRLGFEDLHEAQEWYALTALALKLMGTDHELLERLPLARSTSVKLA